MTTTEPRISEQAIADLKGSLIGHDWAEWWDMITPDNGAAGIVWATSYPLIDDDAVITGWVDRPVAEEDDSYECVSVYDEQPRPRFRPDGADAVMLREDWNNWCESQHGEGVVPGDIDTGWDPERHYAQVRERQQRSA